MELTYRGIQHQSTPAAAQVSPGNVGGKYRGLDWRFRHLRKPAVLQSNLDLIYRGAHYAAPSVTLAPAAPETVVPDLDQKIPVFSVENQARIRMIGNQHGIKVRQQALLLRSVEEVGLDPSVSSHWERIQGKVHPSFRASYERSTVAMS